MADIEGLQGFVDSKGSNRGKAEFFVGREQELALIENASVQTIKRRTNPNRSERENDPGAILFSGAPGTGKSALLAETVALAQGVVGEKEVLPPGELPRLVERLRKEIGIDYTNTPLVVSATPADLKNETSLLDLCAEEASNIRDSARGRALSLGATMLADQFTKMNVAGAMEEIKRIDILQRPLILLLIDEAQHSNADNTAIYGTLHLGKHHLPIVPIFGGLSDSRAALKSAGISRFARGHHVRLGPLSEEDCKNAMCRFLDRYGIGMQDRGRQRWEDFAVEQSAFFPHHLNTVLVSTAETALAHDGELDSTMLPEAQGKVTTEKDNYYEEQAEDFGPEEGEVAAEIVRRVEANDEKPVTLAAGLLEGIANPRKDEHGDIDAVGFVRRMIHCGMLHRVSARKYVCPIPTFSAWLQKEYGDPAAD